VQAPTLCEAISSRKSPGRWHSAQSLVRSWARRILLFRLKRQVRILFVTILVHLGSRCFSQVFGVHLSKGLYERGHAMGGTAGGSSPQRQLVSLVNDRFGVCLALIDSRFGTRNLAVLPNMRIATLGIGLFILLPVLRVLLMLLSSFVKAMVIWQSQPDWYSRLFCWASFWDFTQRRA